MIQQKALNYACLLGIDDDFKASARWLNRFRECHQIVGKVLCGEPASADSESASSWIASNATDITRTHLACNIYNADETGLFMI